MVWVGALILKICEFQILSGKIQLNFDSSLKLKLLQLKFLLSYILPTFHPFCDDWIFQLETADFQKGKEREREKK